MIFDDRRCDLGEGPLWHPLRQQLYWFDILGKRLLTRGMEGPQEWQFDEMVSAAGWLDRDELLIASETSLIRFNLLSGKKVPITSLEAANKATRSNDGRADPQGGFWIGTMAKENPEQNRLGSIWRYWKGTLRRLYSPLAIPNAICFHPDRQSAFFADTVTGQVMRTGLDDEGWPIGNPEVYLDLTAEGLNPDGAVMDAEGVLWLAEWGSARVSAYGPDGSRLRRIGFDAPHTSCPAFGGEDMTTLFCTTALQGMDDTAREKHRRAGMTFLARRVSRGQAEHRVIL